MGNDSIFDNIYNEGLWGVDQNGISTSGVGSHAKDVINPYIILTFIILPWHYTNKKTNGIICDSKNFEIRRDI